MWAAAFVATELAEQPNSPRATMLQEAQALMQSCINNNHLLILQQVPAHTLRYYNPHSIKATQQTSITQTTTTPIVKITLPETDKAIITITL